TLSIKTDPATTWQIEFVQEEKPSNFQIGPRWVGVMGMGGAYSPTEATIGNIAPARSIWGLVGVCVGEGEISARFTPDIKTVTFPVCDGEPRLMAVRYSSPTEVQDVEVMSSGKNLFYTYVVNCADESQCSTQLLTNATPESALNVYCTALKEKNAQL